MILICIAAIIIVVLIYAWLKIQFSYWKRKNIPYIQPDIPYGNLKGVGSTVMIGKRFEQLYKEAKKLNHPFVGIYMFINPCALITDLELLKKIYIKDFQYFHDRDIYHNEEDDPLSAHLLSVTGIKWKKLRSKLSPTFTSGKMKFMFPTVIKVGEKLGDILDEKFQQNDNNGNKIEFQMKELFSRYSTDVIGTCAFGIECNSLKDPNAEFRLYGRKIVEEPRLGILMRLFATFFPNLCRRLHVKSERDDVSEFFLNALKATIDYREKNDIKRNDFLDMMIELKNSPQSVDESLTFYEIAAQAYIFFLGGFETSSTTLGFCIYELAMNSEIQDKARKEIESVYHKYDEKWTYEAIMELHYVHRIVDETLRKYPPISINIRQVTANYLETETNNIMEKGQRIVVPVYGIHHDPEYYPDPEKFDPDRFLPEIVQQRLSFTYLPFGDGPRNCIGKRFGLLQTYIGLVSILRKFKVTPSDKTQSSLEFAPKSFILAPSEPIWLNVEYYKKL